MARAWHSGSALCTLLARASRSAIVWPPTNFTKFNPITSGPARELVNASEATSCFAASWIRAARRACQNTRFPLSFAAGLNFHGQPPGWQEDPPRPGWQLP